MTRWMLLALVACASAQNVDRHEEATRFLEQAAKAHNSPILSALALKVATSAEGSALTKVIKAIDQAYNDIQDQIQKETAADTKCKNEIAQSNQQLEHTKRSQMDAERAIAENAAAKTDAHANQKMLQQQFDDNQQARSEEFESFKHFSEDSLNYSRNLEKNKDAIAQIAKHFEGKSDLVEAQKIFHTMAERVVEQLNALKDDYNAEEKEYKNFIARNQRENTALDTKIGREKSNGQNAETAHNEALKTHGDVTRKLARYQSLRKDIDSQCVKTTVNHEDRAKQRQSEIDSLKQVKEILSQ